MKIVIIHGQNHEGSTCMVSRELAHKVGGEIREFFLPRDFDKPCLGCYTCFKTELSSCPHYKELEPLAAAMLEADLLILESPVYVYHATGQMMSFLDHFGTWWVVHRPRPEMNGKQAVAICTAASGGMKSTAKDILRIYAEPFSYNAGSRRALEKAGFAFEGIMKNNAVKNGKIVDMALYSLTRSLEPYPVRRLSPEEIPAALELCWQVFLEFEAPEYPPEGVAAFRASLDDRERTRQLKFYGAFDGEKLVGVLCMRAPQHIGGFFVDAAYHRRGIGRHLFQAMRRDYGTQIFTVNSSPYAVEIYCRLGFVPMDTERLTGGLRYTPMRFEQGENGL